ncbi:MAG: GNAT family N-acetyltransferase [Saprospiraceae bacterium]
MNLSFGKIEKNDNVHLASMIRKSFIEFDAPTSGTVYSDPTTDDLFALFQHPKSILFVVRDNDIAIGCCGIYPTPGLPKGCTELVKFYLAKEYRNMKIGLRLFQMSINYAKEAGYSMIYLESLPHFAKAIELYNKEGFQSLNAPLVNSEHPGCDIWMVKKL